VLPVPPEVLHRGHLGSAAPGDPAPEGLIGLARELHLSAADRLLDLGSGRGWPGLYLAARTGCAVVLTDLPLEGWPPSALGCCAALSSSPEHREGDVLRVYVEHYNRHRPHRSLGHMAPVPSVPGEPRSGPILHGLRWCDRLGGLIDEHEPAA
jgi:hypothetical protein